MDVPQILEALMLLCFGLAWPFSIFKMWRVRRTDGKSPVFVTVVLCGYLAGLAAKLLASSHAGVAPPPICLLYSFNALLVSVDLIVYWRLRLAGMPAPPAPSA